MTQRLIVWTTVIAGLTLPLATTHAQQQVAPQQNAQGAQADAPPEPTTGLILGRVVDGDTGAPIGGAIVSTTIPNALNINTTPGIGRAAVLPSTAPKLVGTNGDGEFVFAQLPHGTYSLTATAPGYSAGQVGQRRIGGPPQPILLQTGQRMGDITIRMWKYAVVTGTVYDELGEPNVGTQVRIERVNYVGSQKRLSTGNFVSTDDRGVFRASGLLPGDYIIDVPQEVQSLPSALIDAYQTEVEASSLDNAAGVSATMRSFQEGGVTYPGSGSYMTLGDQRLLSTTWGRNTVVRTADDKLAVFPTTFYSSTTSVTEAAVITLTSGQERTGVDIQLRAVPSASVSGRIVGPDGPAINQGVRLIPMAIAALSFENAVEQADTATDATGAFTFPAVPLGAYILRATRIPPVTGARDTAYVDGTLVSTAFSEVAGRSAFTNREAWFAEQPLSVDRNLTNVNVTMSPGYHATGKFVFQGSAPPPGPDVLQRMQVSLVSAEGRPAPGLAPGTTVTPAGVFTSARYQPGHMFINVVVGGSLGPYRLQTLMLGGRSHDVEPFDLTSGDLEGLTIVFTDTPSSLEVAVPTSAPPSTGASSGAAPQSLDAVLFVIPANYTGWLAGGMAPRVSVTAAMNGSRFTVPSLPPGDYLVTVVSSAAAAATHDGAFYQNLARAGTKVSLATGEHRSIDVSISDIR
jgi:hypothetical protein